MNVPKAYWGELNVLETALARMAKHFEVEKEDFKVKDEGS